METSFAPRFRVFVTVAVALALLSHWQMAQFLRTYIAGTFVSIAEGLDAPGLALGLRWAPYLLSAVPAVPGALALWCLSSARPPRQQDLGLFLGLLSMLLTFLLALVSFAAVIGAIIAPNIVRMWHP